MNIKKTAAAVLAVSITWFVLDFIIHGHLLMSFYDQSAQLWRPDQEIKFSLMQVVTLLKAGAFTAIYSCYLNPKTRTSALGLSFLIGSIVALGTGFGSYGYMPISFGLAVAWFISELSRFMLGGLILDRFFGEL